MKRADAAGSGPRIAYLINQYPKVSHTFIRREILALERQGVSVQRIALRGWDSEVADEEDRREKSLTRYVLQQGVAPLAIDLASRLMRQPGKFFTSLRLALRMSRRSDRPWPFHLIYLAEACRILSWLEASGTTHLHAHFGTNSAEVAMLVHALGGPPFSFTVHGPEEFDRPEFIGLAEKIRRSAFVVAISSFGRSQLYRWIDPSHWPKVQVVHCGIEPAFHAGAATGAVAAPRFVCVGRLCEQKGQMLLVEAASRLVRRGLPLELVLAGDGDMRPAIEALVIELGLSANVRITGWIGSDQVRAEILGARALALPSFAEGLPVVIMEAMALGRPVISTYVAGIPELVRPGESGWLIPAGDVDALAEAMAECLGLGEAELQSMGAQARQSALSRHDVDVEAAKLARLFSGTFPGAAGASGS